MILISYGVHSTTIPNSIYTNVKVIDKIIAM